MFANNFNELKTALRGIAILNYMGTWSRFEPGTIIIAMYYQNISDSTSVSHVNKCQRRRLHSHSYCIKSFHT